MFTGIVTHVGEVVAAQQHGDVRRISIAAAFEPGSLALGASVSCGGVCLTATGTEVHDGGRFVFTIDAGPETLRLTTVGSWRPGTRVNLERSLKVGDELGGHIVSGHVDGIATILSRDVFGETIAYWFSAPPPLAKFIAQKGSIALDGTSLTVNAVDGPNFSCHLIPHTLAVTTWAERRPGDELNLEVDLIARYAARLIESR